MIAKKTSKNQLTLPKKVVERFPDVEYFDVRVEDAQITLVPVRPGHLQQVQARLEQLGISEREVREAVAWARRGRRTPCSCRPSGGTCERRPRDPEARRTRAVRHRKGGPVQEAFRAGMVTNISKHGFWLLLDERELLVPFDQFQWFRRRSRVEDTEGRAA